MDMKNSGGTHGKGGVPAATKRNPNEGKHGPKDNGAPEGPGAHQMGYTNDGGMKGDETCSHRGNSFHFK